MKLATPIAAEIAPGVFVGAWKDATTFDGATFCVLDEAPTELPTATHVRIYDDETRRADIAALDRLVTLVDKARKNGSRTLIFCGHGVMRSPMGAIWYLHRSQGLSIDEAYEQVHEKRPKAVHPKSWITNADELAKR